MKSANVATAQFVKNTSSKGSARPLLLAAAMLTLLSGLAAGLLRLGWGWFAFATVVPVAHGPLLASGFMGTLISLERAVGIGKRWVYAAPLLTVCGALWIAVGAAGWLGSLLLVLGSFVLVAAVVTILRLHLALFSSVIALGSVLWLVGNTLWLAGWVVPQVVLWWAGFLILTVVGERLELSRMLRLSSLAHWLFALGVVIFLAGVVAATVRFDMGVRLAGIGLIVLSLWLLRYDIARRRLKAEKQARFIAFTLLSGYGWLGIGGLLALLHDGSMAGLRYDALLHALFLGFVMTMIFAHAPIIFPAVLGMPIHFTTWFYGHVVLLHLSLVLRLTGDLWLWLPGRQWGGLLNGAAILVFLLSTVLSCLLWRGSSSRSHDSIL